ncbi:uncharacterized protein LOC114180661 [Vigna unguiculata]|uniref:uncharacterized protein LOC114180661 n=1 Tax=Vigna unguiculata TaxID=3917 RepID=UPI0010166B0A|nr:uncharacterized protein LOC114180661 [Vigna unguiculata]
MNCVDEQKLAFVVYLLNNDAEYWWAGMQRQMQTRDEPVNWANFRTRFLEKYFPDTAKQDKEAEFLAQQQGNMSVQEYINKFEHLRGLKHELKKVVTPLRERRFPVLVEQAKSVESLERGPDPCGGPHLKRNCPQLTGGVGGSGDRRKCFICDKLGHFANNCQEKKSLGVKKPTTSPVERARAANRVFAMTSTEATQSGVGRLSLEKRDLGCELLVSTPSSGQVATSSVCVGCSMVVAGRRFKGLDVILGMDWLSNNHIIINCGRRNLVFPEHEGLELVSTREAVKVLQEGATCFMVMAKLEKKGAAEMIQNIQVVNEYAYVFSDKVLGLPPSRDVDFTIDLTSGAGPVSMNPY